MYLKESYRKVVYLVLEYLPWSRAVHKLSLSKYQSGDFSCLDIELGGECNYHCVYCDSPDRKKVCEISFSKLEELLLEGSFDWIYVCGLGEPAFNKNYEKLIMLLEYCRKYNLKCSIFSNLSNLTSELVEYIQDEILYLLFKYDSNDSYMVKSLYGTNNVKEQLSNIDKVKKLVHIDKGTTNLAASIVPTRFNKNNILHIVKECLSARIYPLLGELELSGKGQVNYENLYLDKDELQEIKEEVEDLIGESYSIPICPAMISGIHCSYDSYITVDQFSGMSCHWFWLEEPKTQKLMRLSEKTALVDIKSAIIDYRNKRFPDVEAFLNEQENIGMAFGGCGGDIHQIFRQYIVSHRR